MEQHKITEEILLANLRLLLSPKCKSLTELLIVLAAAEEQAIQLLGDQPHPLIKVLNTALTMCDPIKIRRHISKTIANHVSVLSL